MKEKTYTIEEIEKWLLTFDKTNAFVDDTLYYVWDSKVTDKAIQAANAIDNKDQIKLL